MFLPSLGGDDVEWFMMSSTEVKLTKKNSCTSGISSCKTQIQYILFSLSFKKLPQKSPKRITQQVSNITVTLEFIFLFSWNNFIGSETDYRGRIK